MNDWIMNHQDAARDIRKSIQYLKKYKQAVEVHMVPMKPNYRSILPMRLLCEKLGVGKLSLLRFVPQTRGAENVDELGMNKADFVAMQTIIHEELQSESPVEIRAGCPIDFRHALGLIPEKAKMCHAGDDLILVRPNGDVHPCAAWKSLPADANVRDHSLEWIWNNSPVFVYIRRFKEEGFSKVEGCSDCNLLQSCKTGCLAQRLHAYGVDGDIAELYRPYSDPLCPRGVQPDVG
jgi:radical SAM protein with 4Fe4S-binding SPASM domain